MRWWVRVTDFYATTQNMCVCVYLFEKDELHLNLGVLSLLRRAELFYERDNDVIERQELYV